MLNLLLEQFQDMFVEPRNAALLEDFLQQESRRLLSMEHLVGKVVGAPLFDWDERALGEGFMDLVRPSMQARPGSSELYLSALEELGGDTRRLLPAVLFLEYPHALVLINDHFNFHPEFLKDEPDEKLAAAVTQLKYAGQYLGTYPRHLLIQNLMGLAPETVLRTHRLLSHVTTIVGVSRGVFVKWVHDYFRSTALEHYYHFAIEGLFNYVQFPVALAATVTGATEETAGGLRRAFGHLALGLRIRLERLIYQQVWQAPENPVLEGFLQFLTFPGFALLRRGLKLDPARIPAARFPDVRGMRREIDRLLEGPRDAELVAAMRKIEGESLDAWRTEMKRLGILGRTCARLERCLEEAGHAG